jgi:hypothetical protein
MALVTDPALIERLCANVTPQMRRFCQEHIGDAGWCEEWIQGVDCPDPDNTPAFTQEFWWEMLNDTIVQTPPDRTS